MPESTPKNVGAEGADQINYRRRGSRYRARRRAADILFEAETRDMDPVAIVEDRVELARQPNAIVAPVAEYTREIIAGAAEKLDEIDEAIARYLSEDWELHRLPAVDRAILRVSTWELLYNQEVPPATAVVDGVEMAAQYSTDAGSPYIHAVLDDIAQSRSTDNPMHQEPLDAEAEAEDLPEREDSLAVESELASTPEPAGEAAPADQSDLTGEAELHA